MSRLSDMIVPGVDIIFDFFISLTITITFIGLLKPPLLLAPLLYTFVFLLALRPSLD